MWALETSYEHARFAYDEKLNELNRLQKTIARMQCQEVSDDEGEGEGAGSDGEAVGGPCWEDYNCSSGLFCNRDEDPEVAGVCSTDDVPAAWE